MMLVAMFVFVAAARVAVALVVRGMVGVMRHVRSFRGDDNGSGRASGEAEH